MNDELEFDDDGVDDGPDDDALDASAEVTCPYCGEVVVIALDPGGESASQEYVEDCQVCCRPWRVRVSYDRRGAAQVDLQGLE